MDQSGMLDAIEIDEVYRLAEGLSPERWTLSKTFKFEAAHHLPNHDGKCRRLHGHSWVGKLIIGGAKLHTSGPKEDMLMDYKDMGAAIGPLVENYLDHYDLNVTTGLRNPTSEAIARWIYERIHASHPAMPIICVVINETCTSECIYYPHGHWSIPRGV